MFEGWNSLQWQKHKIQNLRIINYCGPKWGPDCEGSYVHANMEFGHNSENTELLNFVEKRHGKH